MLKKLNKGFTLIELMIVASVIAILLAVAIPGYDEYIRRARRSEVQQFMLEIAARQQHFLVDRRAYAVSIVDPVTAVPPGLGLAIPSTVSAFYGVTMVADNAARPLTFRIQAEPLAAQVRDSCGSLFLDQNGTRTVSGSGQCW